MKYLYILLSTLGASILGFGQTLVTVTEGTSLVVSSGSSFTNSNLVLKSVSNSYSNLILDGTLGIAPADVHYDRYVNVVGSGTTGGNDLVSMPVYNTGDDFDDLLTFGETLNDNMVALASNPSDPTEYAFGPYDNSISPAWYVNYNSGAGAALNVGKGYRAATDIGQTIRFSGAVMTGPVSVPISVVNTTWNSIGNPYPSYIDAQMFLDANIDAISANSTLDPNSANIWSYTDGTASGSGIVENFQIINKLLNTDIVIAPGQGFLVSDNLLNDNTVDFTLDMRTTAGTDDFILGRSNNVNQNFRLIVDNGNANFPTEIYFVENLTRGLDVGYDAELFSSLNSGSLVLYSRLVEESTGQNMVIQALPDSDVDGVTIPLGLKASQGQQLTFSIESSTLPEEVEVYLEDNLTNTFTLLNDGDYSFTPTQNINGTGRFFLNVGSAALNTIESDISNLEIYSNDKTIYVNGQLLGDTTLDVYDIQGRLVISKKLDIQNLNNKIDASSLSTNIYVVQITNTKQETTKKLIIK